jgi:hypothetical protein
LPESADDVYFSRSGQGRTRHWENDDAAGDELLEPEDEYDPQFDSDFIRQRRADDVQALYNDEDSENEESTSPRRVPARPLWDRPSRTFRDQAMNVGSDVSCERSDSEDDLPLAAFSRSDRRQALRTDDDPFFYQSTHDVFNCSDYADAAATDSDTESHSCDL